MSVPSSFLVRSLRINRETNSILNICSHCVKGHTLLMYMHNAVFYFYVASLVVFPVELLTLWIYLRPKACVTVLVLVCLFKLRLMQFCFLCRFSVFRPVRGAQTCLPLSFTSAITRKFHWIQCKRLRLESTS